MGEGSLQISQGRQNQLEISADPLVLMNSGVLTINTREGALGKLMVKDLKKVTLCGNVQVDIDELRGEQFMIIMQAEGTPLLEGTLYFKKLAATLYGNALVSLQGEVKDQTIYIKGSGLYAGDRLKTEKTTIHAEGLKPSSVWASKLLQATGSGKVQNVYEQL